MWYISGPTFAEFFDSKVREVEYEETYTSIKGRWRKCYMKGSLIVPLDYHKTAAMITKYRSGANVTLESADRILTTCNIPLTEFEHWAEENEKPCIIEVTGRNHHAQ